MNLYRCVLAAWLVLATGTVNGQEYRGPAADLETFAEPERGPDYKSYPVDGPDEIKPAVQPDGLVPLPREPIAVARPVIAKKPKQDSDLMKQIRLIAEGRDLRGRQIASLKRKMIR